RRRGLGVPGGVRHRLTCFLAGGASRIGRAPRMRLPGGVAVTAVLVLNQNYEPLNVCNARRALVLVSGGKAEVLEHGLGELRSPSTSLRRPSVIRLVYMIKRPRPRVRLTRREIFIRDHFTCQYCGLKTKDLTLDHLIPRHKGGRHAWDNLVSACRSCNHRKGGRTPAEARMLLRRQPTEPRATSYYLFQQYLTRERFSGWSKFMPERERDPLRGAPGASSPSP